MRKKYKDYSDECLSRFITCGGPSQAWVVCKGCGEKWWDYRGGSWDWKPRDCHRCEAKKLVYKFSPEEIKELAKKLKK